MIDPTRPAVAPNQKACLIGIFLLVFSLVALSGPGRIDIVDGQARFEVGKSLALHGDGVIRNSAVWFGVFPGRDGQSFSYYRFPHSVLGAIAVVISDATGPARDERRHFFFVLLGAVAAALLACVYYVWFVRTGLSARRAVAWALAGIICTPAWYYGTSTFDEIFGALAVTTGIALSRTALFHDRRGTSFWSGVIFGAGFNVKEPLGAFALAGLAGMDRPSDPLRPRLSRAALLAGGLTVGIAAYIAFDLYKFPPGTKAAHVELLSKYLSPYPGHLFWGLIALAVSPAAGIIWYCPAMVLSLAGLRHSSTASRFRLGVAASAAIFYCFIASISFFKGDPAWGPRYLTPVVACLWLFAPDGVGRLGSRWTAIVLLLSACIQVLALTVDPDRLYVERGLPPMFGAIAPSLNFAPQTSHLINRPREIAAVWQARAERAERFVPWSGSTSAIHVISESRLGPSGVKRYKVLNAFRPWWFSHWYIPKDQRPVHIVRTFFIMFGTLAVGLALIYSCTLSPQNG
jgi:hypothetical protein